MYGFYNYAKSYFYNSRDGVRRAAIRAGACAP